ncbi:MAG: glycosyltransferase [Polyangiaceae bacterium]|nr:glycosyltransferase [Polyangiaceae bacterium]
MSKPLISLVMIVKDEARGIRATLESVKPWVDRWLVLDTGSTDGTQSIVRDVMEGVSGRLVEEPFVDFGATRNRALELAGDETVFTLMLSGDETVVGGDALRVFCEARRAAMDGAYYVRVLLGQTVYDSARLARTSAGWRYVGVTHEVLMKEGVDPPTERAAGVEVFHDLRHSDADSQRRRWLLDKKLLSVELERNPARARAAFYLAQTMECLGEHEEAHRAYAHRVALGGWTEEVYESLFRMARTAGAANRPWPDVQQLYLDAHAHSPHRAEPLFAIAWHWYEAKNWPLTYLFASRGAAIPFPTQATLFVDRNVYETKLLDLVATSAIHVGELKTGNDALVRLLQMTPSDERLQRLRTHYGSESAVADRPS